MRAAEVYRPGDGGKVGKGHWRRWNSSEPPRTLLEQYDRNEEDSQIEEDLREKPVGSRGSPGAGRKRPVALTCGDQRVHMPLTEEVSEDLTSGVGGGDVASLVPDVP